MTPPNYVAAHGPRLMSSDHPRFENVKDVIIDRVNGSFRTPVHGPTLFRSPVYADALVAVVAAIAHHLALLPGREIEVLRTAAGRANFNLSRPVLDDASPLVCS
jgi:hypothetical protein